MAQVFSPRANTLLKVSYFGIGVVLILLIAAWLYYSRSDSVRGVGDGNQPTQPVPYSHALHVGGLRLQCQYCHNGVTESSYANLPATETCMSCHSQIATDRPNLQPVRDSWESGQPIEWNEVHYLPDFVYFNHSIHVAKGVGCSTCHGNVAAMDGDGVYKVETMYMSWCLNCHRNPEKFIRPREEIYNTTYEPPPPEQQAVLGAQLVLDYGIKKDNLTNCSICHR